MAALDLSRAAWRKSSRSSGSGSDCVEVAPIWRKSSCSSGSGDNCVEVATPGGVVAVRDSKNPTGAKLAFPARAWHAFTAATKAGEFDF